MTNNQDIIFFFGHNKEKCVETACFSNWYPAKFEDINKNIFENSEQFMMYKKALLFNDMKMASKILDCPDPKKVKSMGRKVENFDEKIWQEQCCSIVIDGCTYKFSQNPELKKILLSTKNKLIVEASPYDSIWGIGLSAHKAKTIPQNQWPGKNLLGKCLMIVRNNLEGDI